MHQISDEQLIDFAAGELQGEEAAVVVQHIGSCAACNARLRRFHLIRETLRAAVSDAPPAATIARAQGLMAREPRYSKIATLAQRTRLPLERRYAVAAVAVLLLALCGLSQGVQVAGAASDSALPGDGLYPLKTTMEGLQLAITPDVNAQVHLRLDFAQKRVMEAQQLSAQKRYNEVGTAVAGYEAQIIQATKSLSALAASDPERAAATASQAIDVIASAGAALESLSANVPDPQRPMLTRAVEQSSASATALRGQIENLPGKPKTATATASATAAPSATTADTQAPRPTPSPSDMPQPTLAPSSPLNTPPGQAMTPPGQAMTPPGQALTPPGQAMTPPGQAKTPPGQVMTPPGQDKNPPGQDQNPPGQEKDPPGQEHEPPSQDKEPPGKSK